MSFFKEKRLVCSRCDQVCEARYGMTRSVCCYAPILVTFVAVKIPRGQAKDSADDRFARRVGIAGFILLVAAILLLLCGCGGRRINDSIPHGSNGLPLGTYALGHDASNHMEASYVALQRVDSEEPSLARAAEAVEPGEAPGDGGTIPARGIPDGSPGTVSAAIEVLGVALFCAALTRLVQGDGNQIPASNQKEDIDEFGRLLEPPHDVAANRGM